MTKFAASQRMGGGGMVGFLAGHWFLAILPILCGSTCFCVDMYTYILYVCLCITACVTVYVYVST